MTHPCCIMRAPPLVTTVRVNTLAVTVDEALNRLQKHQVYPDRFTVRKHPKVPDLLYVTGSGPMQPHHHGLELFVDHHCGEAVCRGAPVYKPGIIATSGNFNRGDVAALYVDVSRTALKGEKAAKIAGPKIFLGNGQFTLGRKGVFSAPSTMSEIPHGIAFDLTEPVWDNFKFHGDFGNWGFSQNLPSVLVGHILNPQPGERILDMCAAPGGKSTHVATLMQNKGRVIAIDRSPARTVAIQRNAEALGLTIVESKAFYDASAAVDPNLPVGDHHTDPPFPANYFDRILLDPPCSSLGQRPMLHKLRPKAMRSHEKTQCNLLQAAASLLKPGGVLVYSTCTIRPEENEYQIAALLKTRPEMKLCPSELNLGNDNVLINGVDYSIDGSCQKFSPQKYCARHAGKCLEFLSRGEDLFSEEKCNIFGNEYTLSDLSIDQDTIGFFVAKLTKVQS